MVILCLVLLFALGTPAPALAANTGTISPNPVQPGKTITLNATLSPRQTWSNTMVVFWFNNSSGNLLGRSAVLGIGFTAGQTKSITTTFAVPSTAASGTYSVSATIYQSSTNSTVLQSVSAFTT